MGAYQDRLNSLDKEGKKILSELQENLKSIQKTATKLELVPTKEPLENTQLTSHFGGLPYFEQEEKWPVNDKGKPLSFIFQIFNNGEMQLPDDIKLIQFFYDWRTSPWTSTSDGWKVKVYKHLNKDKIQKVEHPYGMLAEGYCEINFKNVPSLPDWEGIDFFSEKAGDLACLLDENNPWEAYHHVITGMIREQDFQSQLGGYPRWVQGFQTPEDDGGKWLPLLFQVDSEDDAGLMWGDMGLVYVFYDPITGQCHFILQSH